MPRKKADESTEAPKKSTRKKKETAEVSLGTTNDAGLAADGEQSSAETVTEPLTTLDEELLAEEITISGVGTAGEDPAVMTAEYLSVYNETGFLKYTLPRDEAIENARKGGFFLKEATPEEVEKCIRKQRHG